MKIYAFNLSLDRFDIIANKLSNFVVVDSAADFKEGEYFVAISNFERRFTAKIIKVCKGKENGIVEGCTLLILEVFNN